MTTIRPVKPPASGKPKGKMETAREAFHRQQMAHPDVLTPNLDPDPPVLLGALSRFDKPILMALKKHGYPGTGGTKAAPIPVRSGTLAQKIASGSASLSKADKELIAARIGWLQRNAFRWPARNGYGHYFDQRSRAVASKLVVQSEETGVATEAEIPTQATPAGLISSADQGAEAARDELQELFDEIDKLDELTPAAAASQHPKIGPDLFAQGGAREG